MVVTHVETRKNIIKDKRRCFLRLKGEHISKNCTSEIQCYKYSKQRLLLKPGPGPSTWTLKNPDPDLEKAGPSKTWTLKYMYPENMHEINMGLKNMSDFRELCFIKTMRNAICCSRLKVIIIKNCKKL